MKRIVLVAGLLTWFCANTYAQESAFEVLLPYSVDYSYTSCLETSDGYYLVSPGKNMLLKLSPQGEEVGEVIYTIHGVGSAQTRICALLDLPDDPLHHIAVAEAYESGPNGTTSNLLHFVKFDDQLQYDAESVVVVDLSQEVRNYAVHYNARFFIDGDGSVCFAANAEKWDGSYGLMLTRVTANGEVTTHFDSQFSNFNILQACDFTPKNGHYDMVLGYQIPFKGMPYLSYCEVGPDFETGVPFHLATSSQTTTMLQYDNLADSLFMAQWLENDNCTPNWINDSVFLLPTEIMGMSHYNPQMHFGAAVWKIDAGFNILNRVFFDVYQSPANHRWKTIQARNPIVVNNGEVYFCYSTFSGYYGDPQQVAVCKLDTDLNLIWKRWYGGAQEYHVISDFIPTHDGGCLLTGKGSPNPANVFNACPYVLKITSEGYCSVKEERLLLRPYRFFPNPVDDLLQVEYSPDVQPSAVELYDLQGRLLRTQSEGLESIRMGELPAGTYTLRVIMDDGTTYSDKVIQQQ